MAQSTVDTDTIVTEIIRTRQPMVQRLMDQQVNILKLSQALLALEKLQGQIQQSNNNILAEQVREIHLKPLLDGIQEGLGTLALLKARFERPTLNIGVIGRARQGKSRLLQSLSGLSDEEIPTGDLGACTAVRSTIINTTQKTYAEIFFYTEQEFLDDVLKRYYDELQLGPVPRSFNQFAVNALPPLPKQLEGYRTFDAIYKRFRHYKENANRYRELIGRSKAEVALAQVRSFVTQTTAKGTELYDHFAVKEVKIYCHFPPANKVGQITFIDLPGLGDTSLGDEERMLEALGKDLDIALLVRKPVAGGDLVEADTDLSFYDTAQKPLKDVLPFNQWAFLILNRTEDKQRGDNLSNCELLRDFMNANYTNKPFVDSMIVDCSKTEQVRADILEPVLQYLLQNIGRLDEQYVQACQNGIKDLQSRTTRELEKAREIFSGASLEDNDYAQFQEHFDKTWQHLMDHLVILVNGLEQKSNTPDTDFLKYFEGRFDECEKNDGIPPIEDIKGQAHREDSYLKIYHSTLSEMRVQLTYHFIDLDNALENSMKNVKHEVAKVFLQQGELAALPAIDEENFFQRMVELISKRRLRVIFKVFEDYKLSYRGFFQQRIRQHLGEMKSDYTTIAPALKPEMGDDERAKAVFEALKRAHETIVKELRTELMKYVKEPNLAAFAIVEEFIDQAMRAKGAIREWEGFYRAYRAIIWERDFKNFVEWDRWQKEWTNLAFKAQDANAYILLK